MILCDTGIIVASIRENDNDHARALDAVSRVRVSMVTTWPCLTEAFYLLGRSGQSALEKLFRQMEAGIFTLPPPTLNDALLAIAHMRTYADTPMDFADASPGVAAESLGITQILTLDSHF